MRRPPGFDAEGWYGGARRRLSPNQDARPPGAEPELLVIHHISLPPGHFAGDAVERLFTNTLARDAHPAFTDLEGVRVSAHFLVRRRGELIQFVPVIARAWHAGVSCHRGRTACNDFSVGIELEGTGERPYSLAQYRVLARLTLALAAAYPLKALVGHSDIAPGRKTDPGPSFDWIRYQNLIAECGLSRENFP